MLSPELERFATILGSGNVRSLFPPLTSHYYTSASMRLIEDQRGHERICACVVDKVSLHEVLLVLQLLSCRELQLGWGKSSIDRCLLHVYGAPLWPSWQCSLRGTESKILGPVDELGKRIGTSMPSASFSCIKLVHFLNFVALNAALGDLEVQSDPSRNAT